MNKIIPVLILGVLVGCSAQPTTLKSSKTICSTEQCPSVAIKQSENKNYSIFFDVENDDSEIEQVDLVLNGQQNVYKLSDENVENSNTGKSTYIVLNVKKELLDNLISSEKSSVSIKTKNGTFTGIVRSGQQESELYKAVKEFKNNLN